MPIFTRIILLPGLSLLIASCFESITPPDIYGNSHMLMQDRNSDQLADLILAWIDEHVE